MCFARLGGGRILRDVEPVPWLGLTFRSLVMEVSERFICARVIIWMHHGLCVKKRALLG